MCVFIHSGNIHWACSKYQTFIRWWYFSIWGRKIKQGGWEYRLERGCLLFSLCWGWGVTDTWAEAWRRSQELAMQKCWGKGKRQREQQGQRLWSGGSWLSVSNSEWGGWGASRMAWGWSGEVKTAPRGAGAGTVKPLRGFEQRLMGPDRLSVGPLPPPCGDSTVRGAERGSFVRRLLLYPGEK